MNIIHTSSITLHNTDEYYQIILTSRMQIQNLQGEHGQRQNWQGATGREQDPLRSPPLQIFRLIIIISFHVNTNRTSNINIITIQADAEFAGGCLLPIPTAISASAAAALAISSSAVAAPGNSASLRAAPSLSLYIFIYVMMGVMGVFIRTININVTFCRGCNNNISIVYFNKGMI